MIRFELKRKFAGRKIKAEAVENAVVALYNDDSAKGMEIAGVMGTTMKGSGRAGEFGLITLKQLRFNAVVNVPVALWNEEKTAKRYFLPIIPSYKSFDRTLCFCGFAIS